MATRADRLMVRRNQSRRRGSTDCPLFVRVLVLTGPSPRLGHVQRGPCLLG
jgi:hypothetical protein